jgi:hypothetical protein
MVDEARREQTIEYARDFRYVYANTLGIAGSNHDFQIAFGIDADITSPGSKVQQQVTVILTHNSAKLLAATLSQLVETIERQVGPIPLAEDKLALAQTVTFTPHTDRK